LALLDFDTVLEAHSDSLARLGSSDFRDRDWSTFAIDMELVVKDLTVNLFEEFKEFALKIEYPEPLDKDVLYLTFNYTDTLERYYGIPEKNILNIHGKAKFDETVLILGHGINPEKFTPEELFWLNEPDTLIRDNIYQLLRCHNGMFISWWSMAEEACQGRGLCQAA